MTVKITRFDDAFSEIFELEASSRRSISATKIQEKEEKERRKKKIKKPKKPKDVGHFLVQILIQTAHVRAKMSSNAVLVERKACY